MSTNDRHVIILLSFVTLIMLIFTIMICHEKSDVNTNEIKRNVEHISEIQINDAMRIHYLEIQMTNVQSRLFKLEIQNEN